MDPVVVVPETPDEADRRAIEAGIDSYNAAAGGPYRDETLAVLIRDRATGRTVGGLWGECWYDWLFIKLLFVPEPLRRRGLGSELMRTAERLAGERKCVGVWLDTFAFQAPAFYRSLGYEVFGRLPDHPRGSSRLFLRKVFSDPVNEG